MRKQIDCKGYIFGHSYILYCDWPTCLLSTTVLLPYIFLYAMDLGLSHTFSVIVIVKHTIRLSQIELKIF